MRNLHSYRHNKRNEVMQNEKISERQAAKILNIDPSTLLLWRKAGLIPFEFETKVYARKNIRVFYEKKKVEEWARSLKPNLA